MSTSPIESNQKSIIEDKARLKKSYQDKTKHGRNKNFNQSTVIDKTNLSSKHDVSTTSAEPVRTFQNTVLHGFENHNFKDSKGATRSWHGSYSTVLTQRRDNYKVVSVNNTFEVQKDILKPHIIKFEQMVKRLELFAYEHGDAMNRVINQDYVLPAQKMRDLHGKIMNRLQTLETGENDKIDHKTMLAVLKACEQDIMAAKEDGVIAQPRSLVRKTPILSSIRQFLDVLGNYFAFLDKKIGNVVSGSEKPVFETPAAYTAAMYKPKPTHSLEELDALLDDMKWYHAEIDQTYTKRLN